MNEETIKCKKDLQILISKNLMTMSNYSAKENVNVESKTENGSGIQNESQKYENFTDSLFKIANTILIKLFWLKSI